MQIKAHFPRVVLLTAAIVAALPGCTTIQQLHDTGKKVSATATDADRMLSDIRKPQTATPNVVIDNSGMYQSITPIVREPVKNPALRCRLSFTQVGATIFDATQYFTQQCHLPVRISPDAMNLIMGRVNPTNVTENSAGANGQAAPSGAANPGNIPPPSWAGPGSTYSTSTNSKSGFSNPAQEIDFSYTGEGEGYLDNMTQRLGLSWKIEDNMVTVFYTETRTFDVSSIDQTSDTTTTVMSGATAAAGVSGAGGASGNGGASGGVGGATTSSQTTTTTVHSKPLEDLVKMVDTVRTPNISQSYLNKTSGTLVVTDTPEALDRIQKVIDDENRKLTAEVLINFDIIAVQLTDTNQLGVDMNALYTTLDKHFSFNLKNTTPTNNDSILGTATVGQSTNGKASQWTGSQAIIKALSEQGRIVGIRHIPVMAMNLQNTPVQLANQQGYVAQSSLQQTASVGSMSSLSIGNLTVGFNMNVYPKVLNDGRAVMMKVGLNISQLNGIRPISQNNSYVESPNVDIQIFAPTTKVLTGDTQIIAGFQQDMLNLTKQGVGNPNNILLGGGLNSANTHTAIVILATPRVIM